MGKRVLITGASGGIGKAIALCLAKEGYDLLCCYYKNQEKALALQQEIQAQGRECHLFRGDLASHQETEAMARAVASGWDRLEGIVCNGGIAHFDTFQGTSHWKFLEIMTVNLHSIHSLLTPLLPQMIAQGRGSIVTISSMWGQVGASCEVAYSASKAGVIGLTKALASELGPSGIRVNCVSPGLIATDMNQHLSKEEYKCCIEEIPLGRVGTGEEVAELVAFLLSEKASFLSGQILSPNGGQVR